MTRRLWFLAALLVASWIYIGHAMRPEAVPPRESLQRMPLQLERWRGADAAPFSAEILATLGVDDYIDRVYERPGGDVVGLYVGYYESQREGDTIHSPLNCLPAAGWQPLARDRTRLSVASTRGEPTVNRVLIQKGLDRQVVVYWYQSHGRIVASEYTSKALLVYDALRFNRSDAALVRIISPVLASDASDRAADERIVAFAEAVVPQLGTYLPS
jgi:EpsI family protein